LCFLIACVLKRFTSLLATQAGRLLAYPATESPPGKGGKLSRIYLSTLPITCRKSNEATDSVVKDS